MMHRKMGRLGSKSAHVALSFIIALVVTNILPEQAWAARTPLVVRFATGRCESNHGQSAATPTGPATFATGFTGTRCLVPHAVKLTEAKQIASSNNFAFPLKT